MGVLDINNLKTQVQSILKSANTLTATKDLSSGLSTRVQRVLKVHPLRIPIEAISIPYVTMFVSNKDIEELSIGGGGNNRTGTKRLGEVTLNIVGAVMNPIVTDIEDDLASDEIEDLMENIEENLRANMNFNNAIDYHIPMKVSYFEEAYEEESVFRAGILEIACKTYY